MNFLKKIERFDPNICFVDQNDKSVFYKKVLMESEKLSQDLEPRSLIFVLAQNHIEFFTSYIGFFRKLKNLIKNVQRNLH